MADADPGVTRREFLIRTGWVAGGTTILTACPLPTLPTLREADVDDAPSWLQLLPDGRIRFYSPKSEMGQGIRTGLAQVVAVAAAHGAAITVCEVVEPPPQTLDSRGVVERVSKLRWCLDHLPEDEALAALGERGEPLARLPDDNPVVEKLDRFLTEAGLGATTAGANHSNAG